MEETLNYHGFKVKIKEDNDSESPSAWEDTGLFLVADHRQFYVKGPEKTLPKDAIEKYKQTHWIFGLEAYIHSGVRLALAKEGNFVDRQWDVSQLGAVFVSKNEQWKTKAQAKKGAQGLVDTWNQYLNGEVYSYEVTDPSGKELDSCSGFYGLETAKEEGLGNAKHYFEKYKKKREHQLKDYILNHVPLNRRILTPM